MTTPERKPVAFGDLRGWLKALEAAGEVRTIDGETVYACTARLEPRAMTVAPLSNKKLVRDLVTEIAPPAERFAIKGK